MEKKWYILIHGHEEGPYSAQQLRWDSRITPDTLVWRRGFLDWVPIGKVRELKDVFADPEPHADDSPPLDQFKLGPSRDELALDARIDPPHLFWVLLAILLVLFFIIQFIIFKR